MIYLRRQYILNWDSLSAACVISWATLPNCDALLVFTKVIPIPTIDNFETIVIGEDLNQSCIFLFHQ